MDYEQLGKVFKELADACNDLVAIEKREAAGENVTDEYTMTIGKFMVQLLSLEKMKSE